MSEESKTVEMNGERLAVIENIREAVADGDSFRKVEIGDPVVTREDVERVILPFDCLRKKPINKLRALIARKIAESETKKRNADTEIVGLENALGIKGGAIVTSNHFNYMDNTVVRLLALACGKGKKFDIVVQQTNIFMTGYFGFLMRNCNTLPISDSPSYMSKKLKPALKELLRREHFVLIYPEQEMWFNYKKPRALREGAYYYAVEFDTPIIPCFVEMREKQTVDPLGFKEIKHILHVMPPIYPDKSLPERERRVKMMQEDAKAKRDCYERVYGVSLTDEFLPERDIAGYNG